MQNLSFFSEMIYNQLVAGTGIPMRHPLRRSIHQLPAYGALLLLLLVASSLLPLSAMAQKSIPGAENMTAYLPLLKGKKVALVMNQTSRVGDALLVDTLQRLGVNVVKIFVPEHGFRGTANAGAHINNSRDSATGLPIISLYGDNKKPKPEQLAGIDILVYDLQDVGVRFFTYISSLQYCMEACAEQGKQLIVLDRPNPNGYYVAGPVLDTAFKSFVGMQAIPLVYGMTAGEYATMLQGERLFHKASALRLHVIPCLYWDHTSHYLLPVSPSPNLRSANAIGLYPSICLFEGTVISVGRGTERPFEQWGHPDLKDKGPDSFRPANVVGATNPPYEGKVCYGLSLIDNPRHTYALRLQWLIQAYQWYPEKSKFFTGFFEKLAGTASLRKQIEAGMSESAILRSWEPGITAFKKVRKKYLLYPDFE